MARKTVTIDGNEAVAYVAHKTNEVCAIYPITPSSNMGEWADEWSAQGRTNIWGAVPAVVEMQSEGGASGGHARCASVGLADHDLHRFAGPAAHDPDHVQGRRRADVDGLPRVGAYRRHPCPVDLRRSQRRDGRARDRLRPARLGFACRRPWTWRSSPRPPHCRPALPFVHFFDGFRTSHEVQKIEQLTDDDIKALVDRRPGGRPPCAGPVARPTGPARHRPEPRCVLPGPRNGEQVLQCRAGHHPGADGQVRQAGWPRRTTCSTTSARPTPSA